ncbi:UPF0481 protein At3g47200 isoform X2 [Arabidopsis lyrata subsp. lyrata]|uniref:UPF0481 protein At3g47200 isoform X2 n=1 Tax=Arabidopsis lyrata subsp. lyrata TaxID=81972 RepID=UPI000A29DDEB|nr:UPF0481 protein At3g47200 isoform X2 [Arabidopsis lyrata subsp. lyrata]|eukprot:XP_020878617.1 UPF0481 protein At3g47200 isoform X2 [Arabidopsis lyrata subsp. lyrata]
MYLPKQPTGGSTTISGVDDCIVEISRADEDSKILLRNSAAHQSCCIFRIPHTLVQSNETAYKPKIVSIGPYHHHDGKSDKAKKSRFQMIQQHKQRYLDIFLSKTTKKGVGLEDLHKVVWRKEHLIRDSYSEELQLNQVELIDLMVLDGCFILMLFLMVSRKVLHKTFEDPIFMLRWILPTLRSDLLLLENQVPLFLLRDLFETSKLATKTSLNEMIFNFFGYSIKRPQKFWDERMNLDASHLLDLIRKTFVPDQSKKDKGERWTNMFCGSRCFNILSLVKNKVQTETSTPPPIETKTPPPPPPPTLTQPHPKPPTPPPRPFLKLVVSARKLQLRGIKFQQKKKFQTPLHITLKNGVLKIPPLLFDDFFSSLLINCVAFEQFNVQGTTEMTSYVTFMGCLINTADDATFLSEKGIIENYFGTGEQLSVFFKDTGKDIVFTISKSYLANVFEGVNKYTSQGYHVHWAGVKLRVFSPSKVITPLALDLTNVAPLVSSST